MVDVCFDDRGIVERRPEGNLMRANPGKKDLYDPAEEQRRAVVRGIYEGLVAKRLGMRLAQYKALRDLGFHPDLAASKRGTITQREFRAFVDKAERLSIGVGRKQGYVSYMGKKPTPAGAAIAYARYGADPTVVQRMAKGHARALKLAKEKKAAALAKNRKLYEIMLMLARKEQTPRVVEEIVAGKTVSRSHPLRKNSSWKAGAAAAAGVGYHWRDVSTGVKETTPTTISAVLPALDEDRVGYFLVTFDAKNKRVKTALNRIGGWQLARNVTATEYAVGAVREAPALHAIIEQWQGKKKKKFFTVAGPKARPADVFAERVDAEKWAKYLDSKATSYKVPQVHHVWAVGSVFGVEGPQVENAIFDRTKRLEAQEARGEDVADDKWMWARLQFEDEDKAQRQAALLDWQEAKSGAMPFMGYRTKQPSEAALATAEGRWRAGQKAAENYHNLVTAFYDANIPYTVDKSVAVSVERETVRRHKQVAVDSGGIRYMAGYTVQNLREKPDTLFVFDDNMEREGKAGIRGEPNAVGIPTKWSSAKDAYFTDSDLKEVKPAIDAAIQRLKQHLLLGGAIVLPKDGVGTGLAELPTRAPAIHAYISKKIEMLVAFAKQLADDAEAEGGASRRARPTSRLIITSGAAPVTAAERRYAKQGLNLLRGSALSRGEDPEKMASITEESEERGRKALINAIVKISEDEVLKATEAYALKKWGQAKYAKVLALPRETVSMRAKIPGGFNLPSRTFGPTRRTGFDHTDSTLEHLTKYLWPNGEVPPEYLPRYSRAALFGMSTEDLLAIAEEEGISKAQVTKMMQKAEIAALAKIKAEKSEMTGVERIGRGGFDARMTEAARVIAEAQSTRRTKPKGTSQRERPAQPPATAAEAGISAANMARVKQLQEEILRLKALLAPKTNGMWSTGATVAIKGGRLAGKYGTRAYEAARAWAATPGGSRVIAQVVAVGVSMFGARAVKSGKLTPSQTAAIQAELEHRTGQKADPTTIALALHLAGE